MVHVKNSRCYGMLSNCSFIIQSAYLFLITAFLCEILRCEVPISMWCVARRFNLL